MRIIRKKTFEVEWVVPDSDQENQEIQKIIREVESGKEKFDPSSWKPIDNRPSSNI